MDIETVIKRAIEGGYENVLLDVPDMLLDPAFWVALSKSMGWEDMANDRKAFWKRQQEGNTMTLLDEWENVWHEFINHLIEGKSIADFFKNL